MKNRMTQQLCTVCVLFGLVSGAIAESRLGNQVEDFTLKSHRGREWSLTEFADKKVVVIAFLGTECPLVKLYGSRLAEMRDRFAEQGVEFIGINSNTQDSITEMTAFADRYKVTFPMLKDLGNRVADAMGAQRTPEVFVLDADRKVRYHGRIDDQYGVGYSRDKADRLDLAVAIEELLAGKDVSLPETKVIGCHIGRVSQVEPTGDVTYSNHIVHLQSALRGVPPRRRDRTVYTYQLPGCLGLGRYDPGGHQRPSHATLVRKSRARYVPQRCSIVARRETADRGLGCQRHA